VIGRRAGTTPSRAEPLAGFENASCALFSAANFWVGLTTAAVTDRAGAAPVSVAANSTSVGSVSRKPWVRMVTAPDTCLRKKQDERAAPPPARGRWSRSGSSGTSLNP
jgi:hypothetical protein